MASLQLDGLTLGDGHPALIVPLTATDHSELRVQAEVAAASDAELVEWRVDDLASLDPAVSEAVDDLAVEIHQIIGRPLLATVRTSAEGGHFQGSADEYLALITALAQSPACDLIDVEYRHPLAAECIVAVHQEGKPVVGSYHDFESTPSTQQMIDHLTAMQDAGAQICKLAVMPSSPADVARLMLATAMRAESSEAPLLTMAMGPLGAVSRVYGHVFGSCASFASLGDLASAPGQLPVDSLQQALLILGEA